MKERTIAQSHVLHGMVVGLLLLSFVVLPSCERDEENPDEIELFIEKVILSHGKDSLSLALQNLEDANNRHYVDSLYKVFLQDREKSQVKYLMEKNIIEKARTYAAFRCDTEQVNLDGKTPVTQREAAQRMRISRSYVSRLEKSALEKLKAYMESD